MSGLLSHLSKIYIAILNLNRSLDDNIGNNDCEKIASDNNKDQSVEHELETFEYQRQNASGPN